jgi:hypothetical protein
MCEPVGAGGLVDLVVAARLSLVLRDSRLKIIILDDLDIGGGARLSVGVNRQIRWIITSRKRAQRQSFGCHRCEKPPVRLAQTALENPHWLCFS